MTKIFISFYNVFGMKIKIEKKILWSYTWSYSINCSTPFLTPYQTYPKIYNYSINIYFINVFFYFNCMTNVKHYITAIISNMRIYIIKIINNVYIIKYCIIHKKAKWQIFLVQSKMTIYHDCFKLWRISCQLETLLIIEKAEWKSRRNP